MTSRLLTALVFASLVIVGCGDEELGTGPSSDVSFQGDNTAAPDVAVSDFVAPDLGAPPTDKGTAPVDQGNTTLEPPVLQVDPSSYTFSYISPLPSTLTRQITLYNAGQSSLVINSVQMDPNGSADFGLVGVPPMPKTLKPGEYAITIVRFQEIEGGTGYINIQSTDPSAPLTVVELDSYLKGTNTQPEPCGSLQPSILNFGEVERGTTKAMATTLTNCSPDQSLSLTNITRSTFLFSELTDEYQIVPMPNLPTALAPGESLPLNVEYTPSLAGPDVGHFLFHTDDPNEPQSKLDVSGVGVAPPPEELGLRILLKWDSDLCDVDSHLLMPGGTFFDCDSDCHYGNPSPDWGTTGDWLEDPFLDVDDIDGYGPENINISEPMAGTYRFIVHYYSDSYEFSSQVSTNATVELYSYGVLVQTFGPVLLSKTNDTWDVFDVAWPSMTVTTLGNTYTIPQSAVNSCFSGFPF